MNLNVGKELATLQRLSVKELRDRYAEAFGEGTNANNRAWLIKRIAWRLQALEEGGLSERARRRAAARGPIEDHSRKRAEREAARGLALDEAAEGPAGEERVDEDLVDLLAPAWVGDDELVQWDGKPAALRLQQRLLARPAGEERLLARFRWEREEGGDFRW